MASLKWVIERISKSHDTRGFDCGDATLDEFLKDSAKRSDETGFARTYVAIRAGDKAVSGYYTVRNSHVEFRNPPADVAQRVPKYPVPVVRLAGLAVTRDAKGSGLGAQLLVSALQLSLAVANKIEVQAVAVELEDGQGRKFFEHFGFKRLPESRQHLYLSVKALRLAIR